MEEQFHQSRTIEKAQLQALMVRDNRGLLRFLIQYTLLLGSAAVITLYYHVWWMLLPAWTIFGVMIAAMFALGHETTHQTAFKSRALNELVCWLACIPTIYTPTLFRQLHFAHHRHTHDPNKDPEISIGGKPVPQTTGSFIVYLGFATGFPLMMYKSGMIVAAALGAPNIVWTGFLSYVGDRYKSRASWEARALLLFYAGLIVVAYRWLPGLFYLPVGLLFGHMWIALCTLAEHNGLPHEGDICERTRTTETNPLVKFVMWNMPYHAEHHAYPAIPWHALPQLHKLMEHDLKHIEHGYPKFHQRVVQQLSHGHPFKDTEETEISETATP